MGGGREARAREKRGNARERGGEAVSSGSRRRGGGRGEGRTCGQRGCGSRRARARGQGGAGGQGQRRSEGEAEARWSWSSPHLPLKMRLSDTGGWVQTGQQGVTQRERGSSSRWAYCLRGLRRKRERGGRGEDLPRGRPSPARLQGARLARSFHPPPLSQSQSLGSVMLQEALYDSPAAVSTLRSEPQSLRRGRRRASARAHLTLPASLSITQLAATLRPRHLYLFCSTCSCCSHCNSATKGPCRRYTRASALSSPPRPNSTRFLGCRPHAPLSSARSRGVVEPRASCGNVSRAVARRHQRQRNTEQDASRGVRSGTTSRKRVRAQRRKPERRSLQRQGCHQCCERSRMRPEAVRRAQRGVQAREGAPGRGRHSDRGGSSARRELKARAEQLCDQREAQ